MSSHKRKKKAEEDKERIEEPSPQKFVQPKEEESLSFSDIELPEEKEEQEEPAHTGLAEVVKDDDDEERIWKSRDEQEGRIQSESQSEPQPQPEPQSKPITPDLPESEPTINRKINTRIN